MMSRLFARTRPASQRQSVPASAPAPAPAPRPPRGPQKFSDYSTPAVPNSGWASCDFMLGAGMVVFQPSTHKIALIYETQKKYWFLPKGRKDLGESLEQTALREAYEESGYQVEFLPLHSPSHAPRPPHDPDAYNRKNTEPIFVSLYAWQPRRRHGINKVVPGGEYLTSWYVGQVSDRATYQAGTGMPDEQNYTTHFLSVDEVLRHLKGGVEAMVVRYAWEVYVSTYQWDQAQEEHNGNADEETGGEANGSRPEVEPLE